MGFHPCHTLGEDPLRRYLRQLSIAHNPGWIFILPSLGLIGLLGLPLMALVWRAIGEDFFKYVLSSTALSALKLSLLTSTVTVLLAFTTGTPLAYILARWKFRGKSTLELLLDLPVVLPPSVAGLALLIAFGRQGVFGVWLNSAGITLPFTTAAVVIAQTFVSAPLFVRSARVGFAEIDEKIVESAADLGANEWQVFRFILFPLAGRALLTGIVLTWTRALGEFGATILFAGNLEGTTQTMPLAIFMGFERGLGVAIALSVMLVITSILLLGVLRRLEHQSRVDMYH
jgi:molybdate transport system permease protein